MVKRLADFGERKIIEIIHKQYNYSWPDDDAAYIDNGKLVTLITTDSISSTSHIPKGADFRNVGYFFAALNLSDIAAVGGKPRYFMSAFTLPRDFDIAQLVNMETGMKKCLDRYEVKMLGGDLKQGPNLVLTGIAIGSAEKNKILKRSGGKKGDIVCITGKLGKNAAGYYMWKKTGLKKWANLLIDIEPKVKEGQFLADYGATSAIDLSDGLFSAVSQLNKINHYGFEIAYEKIPLDPRAKIVKEMLRIKTEKILNFGGEYELLFTIPRSKLQILNRESVKRGFEITEIGKINGKKNVLLKGGKKLPLNYGGYEHFR